MHYGTLLPDPGVPRQLEMGMYGTAGAGMVKTVPEAAILHH
jgi:hypothetical protein